MAGEGKRSVAAAIDEHVAAFNAHDTGRLLAGFSEDAEWVTGQDRFVGRTALAQLFEPGLWSLAPNLLVQRVVVDGDAAAVQLTETLTVDGELGGFDIAVFFEFADGLIHRAKVYREGSADI
jgi:uncharacterized protein (TIGR02246 family)